MVIFAALAAAGVLVAQWPTEAVQTALERGHSCPALVNEPRQTSAQRSPPKSGRLSSDSGLSRADFGSQIGTSASRLSTYASGKVTPPATLMLRIRQLADRQSRDEP